MPSVSIGTKLTVDEVAQVARDFFEVEISQEAAPRIGKSRLLAESAQMESKKVYGFTTGFGALCDSQIPISEQQKAQLNLIRSHSAGVGKPLLEDVARAIMLLKAHTLAKGHSGVRIHVIDSLVSMLNKKIHPHIPEKGSVGASGDLAPLAHLALAMLQKQEKLLATLES